MGVELTGMLRKGCLEARVGIQSTYKALANCAIVKVYIHQK